MKNSQLMDVILNRASIRDFDRSRKIPDDVLENILLAGIRAPSAGNIQPRTIMVIKDQRAKDRLYELCERQKFMKNAPVWIVTCVDLHRHLKASKLTGVDYDFTGILPYSFGILDASLSLENMVIAAEAYGLGSVMIGSIIEHPEKAKDILELPEHCLALCILCIGYPKRKAEPREKWDRRIIVCDDHYQDIVAGDVSEYWKKFVSSNLRRGKKEVSDEVVEKFLNENSYGKMYSGHYKEEFVKTTNGKLMRFLKKQGFLKN